MNARYGSSPTALTHSGVKLRRALEALNAILKEFIHIKMLSGIKTMGTVNTTIIFSLRVFFSNVWFL